MIAAPLGRTEPGLQAQSFLRYTTRSHILRVLFFVPFCQFMSIFIVILRSYRIANIFLCTDMCMAFIISELLISYNLTIQKPLTERLLENELREG